MRKVLCVRRKFCDLVLDAANAEALCLAVHLEELRIVFFLDVIRGFFHDDDSVGVAGVRVEILVAGLRRGGCPVEAHVAEEVAGAVLATAAVAPRNRFVAKCCLGFVSGGQVPAERACLLGCVECVEPSVSRAVGVLFVIAFAVRDLVVDILGHPKLAANLHELVSLVVAHVGHRHAVDGGSLVLGFVNDNGVLGRRGGLCSLRGR